MRLAFSRELANLARVNAQNLKKDAAYVYSAYALRYVSVLFLIPYYGRVLGPSSYGTVLAAMSLMALVWMVVNYGFSTTGARELASTLGDAAHAQVFGRQLAARLILLPVGIAIGAAGTWLSPTLRANPWFGVFGTTLGVINAMNLGWFYQGRRRFALSLLFEATAYPLNVLFVLIAVRNANDGLNALMALSAASSVGIGSSYVVALRQLHGYRIGFSGGIREIRSASTFFLQGVNAMIMTSGSTYLLSALSTPQQVGYFGSVEKLISFSLAFLQPAAQVLMPTIAHRSVHAPANLHRLVRKGILFEMGYGTCACLGGFILAPFIITLAFGERFAPSTEMMKIMVFALPFAAFTHSVGTYVLIPQRRERWLVMALMIGNVLNLTLIGLLAHSRGGLGVSVARVAGESLTAVVLLWVVVRSQTGAAALASGALRI